MHAWEIGTVVLIESNCHTWLSSCLNLNFLNLKTELELYSFTSPVELRNEPSSMCLIPRFMFKLGLNILMSSTLTLELDSLIVLNELEWTQAKLELITNFEFYQQSQIEGELNKEELGRMDEHI